MARVEYLVILSNRRQHQDGRFHGRECLGNETYWSRFEGQGKGAGLISMLDKYNGQ